MIDYNKLNKGDFLGFDDIEIGLKNGLIEDITNGGLLIGNNHEKGGIKVIIYDEDIGKYLLTEFEGKEFVINPESSKKNLQRLLQINKKSIQFYHERNEIINQHYSANSKNQKKRIINCENKIYYAPYTFVVNVVSTAKCFDELIRINNQN